jgi:replication factor C subunit 1
VLTNREKMKIPPNVVDELIKGTGSDIRQVLNMLSTFKLSKADMDFDEGKALWVQPRQKKLTSRVNVNQKNTPMTPFSIIDKITGPYAFSRTNRDTLNDKSDLYFLDFSWVPLFMQVRYLLAKD